jgi:predicted lipoprotein with Yx(FWY)xxD motif
LVTERQRHRLWPAVVAMVAAFAFALSTAFVAAQEGEATVELATEATHGDILVTAEGFALYTFSGTTAVDEAIWPPITVASVADLEAGAGVEGLGTEARADGTFHVTWNGQPLYTYSLDTVAGLVLGDGEGDGAWAVAAVEATDPTDPIDSGFTIQPGAGVTLTQYTGTFAQLQADGQALGLTSFWTTVEGEFSGYIFGAPDFANAGFIAIWGAAGFDGEAVIAVR